MKKEMIYHGLIAIIAIGILSVFLINTITHESSETTSITGYTPYELSTASYDNISLNFSSRDTFPDGLSFKPDGTKLYIIGADKDLIFQYNLSDPWNVSSAVYENIFLNISSQEGSGRGIFFKPDGTKIFITGSGNDSVHQYSLSNPWNLSSASYDNVSFDVSSQEGSPSGIFFRSDGVKMYITGFLNDLVYQYNLSDPWNVSSAVYENINFSISFQDSSPQDVYFKSDGTKMHVLGTATDFIYQYSLSDPWNVSSAIYENVSLNVSSEDTTVAGMFFKPDGTKIYLSGQSNNLIYQYSLSELSINLVYPNNNSNFSISNINFSTNISDPSNLGIKNLSVLIDGQLNQTFNNSWNLSAASYNGVSLSPVGSNPRTPFFKSDGTKMYILDENDIIYQYTCAIAWNLSSCSYENLNVTTQDSGSNDFFIRPDGTNLYEIGDSNNLIYQYTCSNAWSDISSCVYDNVNITSQSNGLREGMSFSLDGTKLYEIGNGPFLIFQQDCSVAWNLSSCTYNNINISLLGTGNPTDLAFSTDGTKLYELHDSNALIFQATCSTAWNLSSCVYDNVNLSVQDPTYSRGLFFSYDGTRMYEVGGNTVLVYQYDLHLKNDTPYNFSATLGEGNHNWTVQTYDSNDYLYELARFFTIDTTGPSITFSCSPSSVETGETITCTCSATDSLTGVQETTFTENPSTSSTGDFTTSCTSKDNLNNSATANFEYTVTSATSGGGGGSGGSTSEGEPTDTKTSLIVNVNSGETTVTSFESTGVKEITINVNQSIPEVRIHVSKYDSKPAEVSKEISGKLYRYLEIGTENLNAYLEKGTVKFEVNKSWVSENSLQKEDLTIYKFDEISDEWEELETVYESEENENYIYRIELDSFSFFAIVGESVTTTIPETPSTSETPETETGNAGLILWWSVFSVLFIGIFVVGFLIVRILVRSKNEELQ